ncbi:MAG TPA: hypothetical protein VJ743_19555, partial [Albitalea sp.]|nr:hypothetical protein [Albitalea sp.]
MKRTILSRVGLLMLAVLAWLSMPAFAREDIDIYTASSSTAAPNVLFYLDNSSNWSANNNAWSYSSVMNKCNGYSDTATASTCRRYTNNVFCSATSDSATACSGNPSLVQGQIELRALRLVLNETYCNATGAAKLNFNVGIMMGANASSAGSIVDGSSVGTSYIRHAIRPMSDDQCLNSVPLGSDLTKYLIADLNNIDSKITASDFKTSSSFEYGAGLYEAFKYFGGWTNPSGAPGGSAGGATGVAGSPTDSGHFGPRRYSIVNSLEDDGAFTDGGKSTYKSPLDAYGICGKNYIVLIGNTFPNQEFGSNQNATPPTNLLLQRLMSTAGTTPHMSDPSQLYSVTNKSNIRFADEWAQFLFTADVDQAAGKQNLQTFAIDVFNAAQDASQSALLRQMADSGQGTTSGSGYFKVGGDLLALVNALKDILTQVAAVDSVFASAALPVSVNAQGTYLNQVFMGLFRPDENFQQRWYGNLKQYRFARTTSGSLYLADSTLDPTGQPTHAVDAANTGFIQPCATSYWTTDSGKYWQTITGEQSSCGTQTTSLYSDSPDGPVVARGGAAQKLRSLASRNLRTCSSTTSCTTGLVDFNATNVTAINSTLVNWIRG